MSQIMEGRSLADEIKRSIKKDVEGLHSRGVDVGLALLLVGDNAASKQYFSAILGASKKVGVNVVKYVLPETASINEILNVVNTINSDERINGLLVLFPLPHRVDGRRVVNAISPEKDIDGLGAISVGRLSAEESTIQLFKDKTKEDPACKLSVLNVAGFLPCTPFGVIRLCEYYGVDIQGKSAVVIGKSLSVGKPLALMLLAKEATVTVCHKATTDLNFHLKNADIICTATGVKNLIKKDMIKEGSVVIDIGINVLGDGKIVGDLDFNSVKETASMITPVPGGVGPVTIAMLLENTVRSAQRNEFLKRPTFNLMA